MSNPSIFIAAGGTGGHIFPALAVAAEFNRRNVDVVFIGAGKELEKKLLKDTPYQYEVIDFTPVSGKGFVGILNAIVKFPRCVKRAFDLIEKHKPRAVVGFGGYPSVVPAIAGWCKTIDVFLQEQNIKVGSANRLLSLFCKRIFAVHGASGFIKARDVYFITNPVREEFLSLHRWRAPATGAPFVVLVVGGSQGAVSVNSAVLDCLELFSNLQIKIVHQTGDVDFERCYDAYQNSKLKDWRVERFIDDISKEYEGAHLVVSRAGAMTVAEVVAAGRPAIFIPLNIAGGHQRLNADLVANAGGAIIVEQTELLSNHLMSTFEKLFKSTGAIEKLVGNLETIKRSQEHSSAKIICDSVMANWK